MAVSLRLRALGEALPGGLAADPERSADVGPADPALAQDVDVERLAGGDVPIDRLDLRYRLQQLLGLELARVLDRVEMDLLRDRPRLLPRLGGHVDALAADRHAEASHQTLHVGLALSAEAAMHLDGAGDGVGLHDGFSCQSSIDSQPDVDTLVNALLTAPDA